MTLAHDSHSHPIYNSTYALYRVSPLHHGEESLLNPTSLRIRACRLRDVLKGDTLRGVYIGADNTDAALSATGKLDDCTWDLVDEESLWTPRTEQKTTRKNRPVDRRVIAVEDSFGIHIQLHYERATYAGLLLRNIPSISSKNENSQHIRHHAITQDPGAGFTSLPLLLLRIPQPTRQAVLSHLSRTFDAHIAPLQLSSPFLTRSLERLLHRVGPDQIFETETDMITPRDTESLIKSLHLQLSFPTVSPLLKTLDISIQAEDVPKLLRHGLDSSTHSPFTTALSSYLTTHLALAKQPFPAQPSRAQQSLQKPEPPSFHVAKIACAPLALARDGKLKLVPPLASTTQGGSGGVPSDAARDACMEALRELVEALVEKAAGGGEGGTDGVQESTNVAVVRGAEESVKDAETRGGQGKGRGTSLRRSLGRKEVEA